MSRLCALVSLTLACVAAPAVAGPPYLTDDPAPTETGHWEIYGFVAGEGRRSTLDIGTGVDLNYGPVPNVQLTATLPLAFSHAPSEGWQRGTGDLELGVKYRFFHDEKAGVSAAIFPRAILPTASHSPGAKTRFLLPLWVGKDLASGTSLFGGGGYTINPGSGNRDFWQIAAAVTHALNRDLSAGVELTRQGADTARGTTQTRAGIGSILRLSDNASVLVSGGPTWADHQTSYRFYGALGLNF